ncbi:MAG: YqaA family protein [Methylotenera sp.]|nr:YqaA family protein [Methylotenera sp.]
MKIFSALYQRAMQWARLPNAPWYLGVLSFAESSFFPIPPDVMLAPMSLAKPESAWRFALITTVTSVLGGMFGYLIGYSLFDVIEPHLMGSHYWDAYQTSVAWFKDYGFLAIFIAGFSPIPYKVFTIAAGTLSMAFLPFVVASIIGRGLRFFMVAGLMKWGGASMEAKLHQYVDRIGWVTIAAIIMAYFMFR